MTPDPAGLKAGDPIPGSKLYRGFCPRCWTPMRVNNKIGIATECERCNPPHVGVGRPPKIVSDEDYEALGAESEATDGTPSTPGD